MSCAALVGVRSKLSRAQAHLTDVNARINSLLGPDGYSQEVVDTGFENRELVIRAKAPKTTDSTLSLVIGDCVHNVRSALDHLVLQLAVLNNRRKEAERKTAFPIALDREAFDGATRGRVAPFVAKEALDAIEELQPYRTLNPEDSLPLGRRAVLWVLSELDNIDKHRIILVAQPQIRVEGFDAVGGAPKVKAHEKWSPLVDGQEVARFEGFLPTKLRLEFATIIHFQDTGLCCDGMGVQSTLENIVDLVSHIINEFEKRFFR
jgi:hypothetical protein